MDSSCGSFATGLVSSFLAGSTLRASTFRTSGLTGAIFSFFTVFPEASLAGSGLVFGITLKTGDGVADEGSMRGSSEVVAARIRDEIQKNVAEAGIEVVEARITYLAYAPEIAAVMLQRQQASAIIDARKMIVDGAVGMVEMALDRLSENKVVELDDERKAAMVSNLLVVLCGNRDAQPIVNSGSLY